MFGFDDAFMMAFADEAAMTYAAEAAAADAAATAAADAAATAAATNFATDAAMMDLAGSAGLGAIQGGLGAAGAGAGAGITAADMAANVMSGAGGAGASGINQALVNASQSAATGVPNAGIANSMMTPAQQAYLQASQASVGPGITQGLTPLPPVVTTPAPVVNAVASGAPSVASPNLNMFTGTAADISSASNPLLTQSFVNPGTSIGQGIGPSVLDPQVASGAPAWQEWAAKGGVKSEPSFLEKGMETFKNYVKENPISSGMTAFNLMSAMNKNNLLGGGGSDSSYSGPLSKYRMSSDFKGSFANPEDFQPRLQRFQSGGITDIGGGQMPVEAMSRANAIGMNTGYPQADISGHAYATPWQTPTSQNVVSGTADTGVNRMDGSMLAKGGIASFKRGGETNAALDYYRQMTDNSPSLPPHARGPAGPIGHDPGIYYDMDPDTRYQDALTAAQIRQAKINKRTGMQLPAVKRPTPMGTLNLRPPGTKAEQAQSSLDPENAAQGGIMQAHSSLGGYAAGGNPRLLKGPGDGMSDNIPATIANKQPARLADGEFVIPADVVSHLGNGSTDAGAKKLHQMMDNVRQARTGRKAQGKQINPNKFMPK